MNSILEDQTSSCSSDIDICNTSPDSSLQKFAITTTSTPYKPRVNFRSIESLATSSFTPISSPSISCHRQDDTGYSSFNSPSLPLSRTDNKENHHNSITGRTSKQKPRRKLSDWQIWYLRKVYAENRYPSPYDQEQIASQLLLPTSSIRIWFQNYRARYGKK